MILLPTVSPKPQEIPSTSDLFYLTTIVLLRSVDYKTIQNQLNLSLIRLEG